MRQQKPPAGTLFLLCTKCGRGEWRRVGAVDRGQETLDSPPPCRHCSGPTVQRHPFTLALTAADRRLITAIAEWEHTDTQTAAINAVRQEFRRAATARAGKGKPLPQWAADWLQTNPDKPL